MSEVAIRRSDKVRTLKWGLVCTPSLSGCWPAKPKFPLKGFSISDRTVRVRNEFTPTADKKRVQVSHEVCEPVQIRKNPAAGRTLKPRA